MISIVISSADTLQLQRVIKNIDETIGVPYEIISFDNRGGKDGLCKLYNVATDRAKYQMMCFMHEDVEIVTNGWGSKVLDSFRVNPKLGLLGIAGNNFKSSVTGRCEALYGSSFVNIIQHYKYSDRPTEHLRIPEGVEEGIRPVVCVDGVWFCTPKLVAEKYRFDENLAGFHGYDLDFSLSVHQHFEAGVDYEILIHHFSEGNFSRAWLDAMLYIHEKRKHSLPAFIELPHGVNLKTGEKRMFRYLIKKYRNEMGLTRAEAMTILNNSCIRQLGLRLYMKMYFYILKLYIFK